MEVKPRGVVAWLAALGVALLLGAIYLGLSSVVALQRSQAAWEVEYTHANKVSSALSDLRSSTGYGAFIHNFKNLVLRRDIDRYRPEIEADLARSRSALDRLDGFLDHEEDETALQTLRRVLEIYAEKHSLALSMIEQGASPTEIDKVIRVNDKPAITAYRSLSLGIEGRLYAAKLDAKNAHSAALNTVKSGLLVGCSAIFTGLLVLTIYTLRCKRANRELEGLSERLSDALNELRDVRVAYDEHSIVAITDVRGKITYVNDKFCDISQYSREELIGQDHRLINSGHHPKEFFKGLWSTVAQGKVWKGKIQNRAKDGSTYWVDTTIVPFLNSDGKPYQYVAIRTDITQSKRVEHDIRDMVDQLSRSNKELEDFAYVASHDLQEPLRKISSYTQLLREEYGEKLDETGLQYLDVASSGASRLKQLVSDLLSFSRITTRGKDPRPTDAEACLLTAIDQLELTIHDADATVTHDPLPTVIGEESQLVQLFQNLIGNAIKYRGDEAPVVHVSVKQDGDQCEFSVEDNGIGFDQQFADRVFQIFQRLHNRRAYEGTGIGLAFCKRIVERFGGTIGVVSSPGAGSTFHFSLITASQEGVHDERTREPECVGAAD